MFTPDAKVISKVLPKLVGFSPPAQGSTVAGPLRSREGEGNNVIPRIELLLGMKGAFFKLTGSSSGLQGMQGAPQKPLQGSPSLTKGKISHWKPFPVFYHKTGSGFHLLFLPFLRFGKPCRGFRGALHTPGGQQFTL